MKFGKAKSLILGVMIVLSGTSQAVGQTMMPGIPSTTSGAGTGQAVGQTMMPGIPSTTSGAGTPPTTTCPPPPPSMTTCLEGCGDKQKSCNAEAAKILLTKKQCEDEAKHTYEQCCNNDCRGQPCQKCNAQNVLNFTACNTLAGAYMTAWSACAMEAGVCAAKCIGVGRIKECFNFFKP